MNGASHPRDMVSRRRAVTWLTAGGLAAATRLAVPAQAAAAAATPSGMPGAAPTPAPSRLGPPDPVKADAIRTEFLHAWGGYKRFAWGHDEVLPVSGGYQEFFAPGHPVGLSIVEALDTHFVMGLDDEVAQCVAWIESHLDFDIDADFHVFEANIRLVGGLISGYLATGRRSLLTSCTDLADRLLTAFTSSPTGMPYSHVNLRTGEVSGTSVPLAEIGTNILEFGVLSQLTGNPKYYRASKLAYRAAIQRRSSLNLLGTTMNIETGEWTDSTDAAPNPPADSFYEYLWGGWAMFGDTDCLGWFHMFDAAFKKYQVEWVDGLLWFKQVDFNTGEVLGRQQSELAVDNLSEGGDNTLAADFYRSWTAVLDKYAVIPEEIDYTTLAVVSPANELRPEYANCAFDLYGHTGDPFYRTTAWRYFENLRTYHRVANGYTIITDVTKRPMVQGDYFPAYSFAENFKWLYLTFSDTPRFDYRNGYLNTEAKVLRGLRRRA
ncbi:glycoside hydrolase family 47 protein [Streptomyces sp. RB6PN25]|uniref:Glycoside hydrolase family 47 protein n=1 Tax=Streptomyces humicola TaxID=2953240 RepID=A0ABT1Q5G9_9ACTN|nr:glycoside hydrolase family 47 protein [Streptomyces humicola]MCQ4085168.1 glycoside hydrolase family 47 protein [Streptomyces humicola]